MKEDPAERSRVMACVKSANTTPELRVRRSAHRLGFRYRLNVRALPGSPDLVFPRLKKAIFVHGCFWHRHRCKKGKSTPEHNRSYWLKKFERNVRRDAAAKKALRRLGWKTLIVWECQTRDEEKLSAKVAVFLGAE